MSASTPIPKVGTQLTGEGHIEKILNNCPFACYYNIVIDGRSGFMTKEMWQNLSEDFNLNLGSLIRWHGYISLMLPDDPVLYITSIYPP